MQKVQDETLLDKLHTALLHLRDEIADDYDRDQALAMMSSWGRKSTRTMYDYLTDFAKWPGDLSWLLLVSIGSSSRGYLALHRALGGANVTLTHYPHAVTDGNLSVELAENTRIWGDLLAADAADHGRRMVELAAELHTIANQVQAEGLQKLGH